MQRIKNAITVFDALTLATFIVIGVDKALSLGRCASIAFFSGVITAVGGGIWSSILSGTNVAKVLRANPLYRTVTALNTLLYIALLKSGLNHDVAQYILVACTFTAILATNETVIKKSIAKMKKAVPIQRYVGPATQVMWGIYFCSQMVSWEICDLIAYLSAYNQKIRVIFISIRRKRLRFCS